MLFNIKVEFIWHRETDLKNCTAILIPGGFSYGDYLRTGAIARFSPIMNSVIHDAKKGKPVVEPAAIRKRLVWRLPFQEGIDSDSAREETSPPDGIW